MNISLEAIIRDNSWFPCENCDLKSKGLKRFANEIHTVNKHMMETAQENLKVLVLRKENRVEFHKSYICWFKQLPGSIYYHL